MKKNYACCTRLSQQTGQVTEMATICTPSHPYSRTYGAIPRGTVIGPVVRALVAQLLGNYGFVIEIPSPKRPETTSWVVKWRGWVAFSRSQIQSHKVGITFATSNCHRRWTLFYRNEAIWHWGNAFKFSQDSMWSSVLNESNCTHDGKWSCLLIIASEIDFNRDLKIGHEMGSP